MSDQLVSGKTFRITYEYRIGSELRKEKIDSLQLPSRSANEAKHCIVPLCNQYDILLMSSDFITPARVIISILSNDLDFGTFSNPI